MCQHAECCSGSWRSWQPSHDAGARCVVLTEWCALPAPRRQLGIGNFEPLKPAFLEVFSGAQAALPGLPGTGALPLPLGRGWSSADERKSPTAPALVRALAPDKTVTISIT